MQIKDIVNGKNQSIAFWIMSALMGILTIILSVGLTFGLYQLNNISEGNEQRAMKIAVLETNSANQANVLIEIKSEMKELNKTMSDWQKEWREEYMKKRSNLTEPEGRFPDMGAIGK